MNIITFNDYGSFTYLFIYFFHVIYITCCSTTVLKPQATRIITNVGRRDSCRQLFKQLQILPLPSQYIFSLLVFVNRNKELFLYNSEIYEINTRYNHNLHLLSTNLTLVQRGVMYSGSKIYSHLPLSIKAHSNNAKRFKATLKRYLVEHSFYSVDEYYHFQ
jgi:hypothetical protein